LLPCAELESTVGPTLMLALGGSMLDVDDSSDLLETMRYMSAVRKLARHVRDGKGYRTSEDGLESGFDIRCVQR
jgi:hypothetical protein